MKTAEITTQGNCES